MIVFFVGPDFWKSYPGIRAFFVSKSEREGGEKVIRFLLVLCATMMLLLAVQAQAAPLPPDVSITGSANFDSGFALADGDVVQGGSYFVKQGGVDTTTTYSGVAVVGSDPLNGALTHTGDGFGLMADSTATDDGEFAIGIDTLIDLANASATDSFKVTFKVDFDNSVDADGLDSYAQSEYTVDTSLGTEVFFTDILSDTVYGDESGGVDIGTHGDPVSDNGIVFFDVVLAPLGAEFLDIAYTLEGGVFDNPGMATVGFSAFLSVDSVENLTPAPIPEPGTLLLLATGLGGMAAVRRRRQV